MMPTPFLPMLPAPSSLPFVLLNLAISADGKISTANRRLSAPGSRHDHDHLLALRATVDAVMCGARTLDGHPITLGAGPGRFQAARRRTGRAGQPLRVLVSGRASLNPRAAVFGRPLGPLILVTTAAASPARLRRLGRQVAAVCVAGDREVDWPRALAWLRREWGVQRLLGEGGAGLNDSLFRAGVVEEIHLTWCPLILGGRTAPTLADGRGVADLEHAAQFRPVSCRRVGDELYLVYRRRPMLQAPAEQAGDSPSVSTKRAISHSTSESRLR